MYSKKGYVMMTQLFASLVNERVDSDPDPISGKETRRERRRLARKNKKRK